MRELSTEDRWLLVTVLPLFLAIFGLHLHAVLSDGLSQPGLWVYGTPSSYPTVGGARPDSGPLELEVHRGDRLLVLDGVDLRGYGHIGFDALAISRLDSGDVADLVIEQGGEERSVEFRLTRSRAPWVRIPPVATLAIVALLVLLRARDRGSARRFFVTMMLVAVMQSPFATGGFALVFTAKVVFFILNVLVPPLVVRWALWFPPEAPPPSRQLLRAVWLLVPIGVGARANYFLGIPALLPVSTVLPAAFDATWSLATIAALTVNYRRSSPIGQRRVKWLLLGIYVGLLPLVLVELMQSLLPVELYHRLLGLATLATVAIPVGMVAAIARQNLFDINRLLSATAFSSSILLALLATVMFVAPRLAPLAEGMGIEPSTAQPTLTFVLAALIFLGARPLRRFFDSLFVAEREAFERGVRELLSQVSASSSPQALVESIADRLVGLLEPESHSVYHRRGRRFVPLRSEPEGARELATDDPAVAVIGKLSGSLVAESSSKLRQLSPFERAALEELGGAAVVPIRGRGGLEAFIILGRKESGDVFVSSESAWLSAVADKASSQLLLLETGSTGTGGSRRGDSGRGAEEAEAGRLSSVVGFGDEPTVELSGVAQPAAGMGECPACGLCFDGGVMACAADGVRLLAVGLPRQLERRYQLERKLGSGGMGAVYEATDLALRRKTAVKVIRHDRSADPRSTRRFRREAQSVASFSHPNVVTVFDFGVAGGETLFLVMERLEGESLQERIRRAGRLAPADAMELMDGVTAGIGSAHEAQLVHRDLKPANIFLHLQGDRVTPKILDFGLVKALAEPDGDSDFESRSGIVLGTPGYVSPECLRNDLPAPSWDLWGLGVVAFEMLTGERPFQGQSMATVQLDVLLGRARPLESFLPEAPAALGRFFVRALDPEPERRPPTAADFYHELLAAIGSWAPSG